MTMKKRILPLLLLGLPYFYLVAFNYGLSLDTSSRVKFLIFLIIWILLFLAFFIGNLIFVIVNAAHGVKSEFFLFWNMVMKLVHIPVYLLIFSFGMMFAIYLPAIVIITPFLMSFDYMLLILTSMFGIGGIVQAAREKKLTIAAAVVLGILHFVFCADVVCAVVAFCKVKSKDRKLKQTAVRCEVSND